MLIDKIAIGLMIYGICSFVFGIYLRRKGVLNG